MASPTIYNWSNVELEQLNPLLQRQYVSGEKAMIARIHLSKGCFVPTHSHHHEQISILLQGRLQFDFGNGDIRVVGVGDILVIPGGAPHSATALEDSINVDFFAPPRQDWIDKEDAYLR